MICSGRWLLPVLLVVAVGGWVPAKPALAQIDRGAASPVRTIANAAEPITGASADHTRLVAAMAGARRILLGESTHGTREYYRERARLTLQLIRNAGINAIAIEGDWTPTNRVNMYVRGLGSDRSADEALQGYTGFPRWVWRNAEFRDFVEELRRLNQERPQQERVGLYGMDVYDMFEAADAVVVYLQRTDRAASERVRRHYRCIMRHHRDPAAYAIAARDPRSSCKTQVEAALAEVREATGPQEASDAEAQFAALRSAASVVASEEYFRAVYVGSMSWNVRDRHMTANVEEIAAHVETVSGREGKVVVWTHNSHAGDARSTSAPNRGEVNIGQLLKERHGDAAFAVGFFSYVGTVRAAPEWGGRDRSYEMGPALEGSYCHLFHQVGLPAFSLLLRGERALSSLLKRPLIERAIGVVYDRSAERQSHYFEARLADQFDGAIFIGETSALSPL